MVPDVRFPLRQCDAPLRGILIELLPSSMRGKIELLCIFRYHPFCVENRRKVLHCLLHPFYPFVGDVVNGVPLIKERDDFLLKQFIHRVCVRFVNRLRFFGDGARFIKRRVNCPAAAQLFCFGPPPISDAEIQHAVRGCFHAAGSACFIRWQRIIEPDIYAINEVASDTNVVVFNEDDFMLESWFGGDAADSLDEQFSLVVVRVRLSCENELDRHLRIIENLVKPVDILEQECGPLVSCESAREPDSQCRRIEDFLSPNGRSSCGFLLSLSRESDEAFPTAFVYPPQLRVWNLRDLRPDSLVGELDYPTGAEVSVEETLHVTGNP